MNSEVIFLKSQRILFVLSIMVIALFCFVKMNMNYNRLSRYQYLEYMSEQQQEIVCDHLNDKEIEYLIEYAISPSEYLDYIEYHGFSIYHVEYYEKLAYLYPYLDSSIIVELVEKTGVVHDEAEYSFDELCNLLTQYDASALLYWVENKDVYNPDSELVYAAAVNDVFLTDNRTISKRYPYDLVLLTDIPVLNDEKEISVSKRVEEPLKQLCNAIVEDGISKRSCGGLVVKEGFISYDEQENLFKQAQEEFEEDVLLHVDYPGHSEHQLGLAVDFGVTGIKDSSFTKTKQYTWLKENAWKYGFIQTYPEEEKNETGKLPRYNHWRFVGIEEAKIIFERDLSIIDCIENNY